MLCEGSIPPPFRALCKVWTLRHIPYQNNIPRPFMAVEFLCYVEKHGSKPRSIIISLQNEPLRIGNANMIPRPLGWGGSLADKFRAALVFYFERIQSNVEIRIAIFVVVVEFAADLDPVVFAGIGP